MADLTPKTIAADIAKHACLVVEIDQRAILGYLYGHRLWRLKLGMLLVQLAARILRCKCRFHSPSNN